MGYPMARRTMENTEAFFRLWYLRREAVCWPGTGYTIPRSFYPEREAFGTLALPIWES